MKAKTIILFLVLVAILVPVPINAQPSGFKTKIAPSKVEITGTPGLVYPFEVRLYNKGNQDRKFKVFFNDYYIKPDNNVVFKNPGYYTYSCSKWLSTDSSEMLVPAGKMVAKQFQVQVPQNAEPGGHYGAILFESEKVATKINKDTGDSVAINARLASLVMVTVPGEIVRKVSISSVKVDSNWFLPSKSLAIIPPSKPKVTVTMKNEGNVHATLRCWVNYSSTFGWGYGKIYLGEMTILPGTTRIFTQALPKPPLLGSYNVKATIKYGPVMGDYSVSADAKTTFATYPTSIPVWIFGLLAILGVPIVLIKRKKSSKKVNEEEPEEEKNVEESEGSEGNDTPKDDADEETDKKE